jgi:hypothetical protein
LLFLIIYTIYHQSYKVCVLLCLQNAERDKDDKKYIQFKIAAQENFKTHRRIQRPFDHSHDLHGCRGAYNGGRGLFGKADFG